MSAGRLSVHEFWRAAVRDAPNDPFLIWDDSVTTYAQFDERVDRAAAMWYRRGVRKGDRVVFMLDNSPEFIEAWFGLIKIGAVLSAVNTGFKLDEAAYQIRHSEAKAALIGAPYASIFESVVKDTALDVLRLGQSDSFDDYSEVAAAADPDGPTASIEGDDLISLIYTSGTTGHPKGVMQTHRTFVLTGQAFPWWLDIRRNDRLFVCMPYFHINSQSYSTMGSIGARATIVLAPRFSASSFWPDVRRHGVTHFNFVGAMTMILARRDADHDDSNNSVRTAYGGTKLPYDLQMDVEKRFGLKILSGFGMSETTFGFIEDVHGERRPGSIGKPRQHPDQSVQRNEARLVDDDGEDVVDGEVGELLLRNPTMARGYFKDPDRTAEVFRDGWLHTGDLLRRDDDGFYFFVDRKKDIIRRRGENISSTEVERVLVSHPDVAFAAVVAVPSELTDDEVLAYIVREAGHDIGPADLLEWVSSRLARFKVPRYLRFVDELPRTGSHKVKKEALRSAWRQPDVYDRETGGTLGGAIDDERTVSADPVA